MVLSLPSNTFHAFAELSLEDAVFPPDELADIVAGTVIPDTGPGTVLLLNANTFDPDISRSYVPVSLM